MVKSAFSFKNIFTTLFFTFSLALSYPINTLALSGCGNISAEEKAAIENLKKNEAALEQKFNNQPYRITRQDLTITVNSDNTVNISRAFDLKFKEPQDFVFPINLKTTLPKQHGVIPFTTRISNFSSLARFSIQKQADQFIVTFPNKDQKELRISMNYDYTTGGDWLPGYDLFSINFSPVFPNSEVERTFFSIRFPDKPKFSDYKLSLKNQILELAGIPNQSNAYGTGVKPDTFEARLYDKEAGLSGSLFAGLDSPLSEVKLTTTLPDHLFVKKRIINPLANYIFILPFILLPFVLYLWCNKKTYISCVFAGTLTLISIASLTLAFNFGYRGEINYLLSTLITETCLATGLLATIFNLIFSTSIFYSFIKNSKKHRHAKRK